MPKSNDSSLPSAEIDLPKARKALSDWFAENARDLPWRSERSVYRTVVSEFMLQQTRVSTVIPYFERWMGVFPDFARLAAATESEVLRLWQGLGYYSRARNLHKLAQRVVDSGVPESVEGWKDLPGIGEYTSAAIASIAQDQPSAVVDGNVVRVLARLSATDTTWRSSGEAVKAFSPLAAEFLDRVHPGRHNEAVMELGALVCLPRTPLCTVCPLVKLCRGAASGVAGELPRIVKPKKVERTVERAWVVDNASILLQEIPPTAKRLPGMLELPKKEDLSTGWRFESAPLATRKRGIGNESITEPIFRATRIGAIHESSGLRRVPLNRLEMDALSGPHRRWIGELLELPPLLGRGTTRVVSTDPR